VGSSVGSYVGAKVGLLGRAVGAKVGLEGQVEGDTEGLVGRGVGFRMNVEGTIGLNGIGRMTRVGRMDGTGLIEGVNEQPLGVGHLDLVPLEPSNGLSVVEGRTVVGTRLTGGRELRILAPPEE
jgi:hypothetical protein